MAVCALWRPCPHGRGALSAVGRRLGGPLQQRDIESCRVICPDEVENFRGAPKNSRRDSTVSADLLRQERLKLLDVLRSVAMTDQHGIGRFDDDQVFNTAKGDQPAIA